LFFADQSVEEGGAFGAGDAIAKIETDKASIDFEAQDDGFLAKIVEGTGNDLAVGAPIMITAEEKEDVTAFKDYMVPESEAAPKVTPPVEAAPVVAPVVVAAAPPVPAVIQVPAVAEAGSEGSVAAVAWGQSAATAAPLAQDLGGRTTSLHGAVWIHPRTTNHLVIYFTN